MVNLNFVKPGLIKGIPASKRALDLLLVIPGLLIISPLIGLIAFLVRQFIGTPILFKQIRPGYQGKLFGVYKFRSMREAYDVEGRPLPDEQRLTKFGRFLRSASLDELPELVNILRGEMSLVGPRPLLVQYLERYSSEQARRHEVLPGLTGWAQVNGRNNLNWEEKFRLDVWYVDHWSPSLDLKILCMTLWKVIRREGISQAGQATAEEFMGSPLDPPGK
ncbi:MAG TPA: sugar transferase [Anaerolineaceae bacterium]|jgi:sugar transferase EpsL